MSQRIVREVLYRYLKKAASAAETSHYLWFNGGIDSAQEYHLLRVVTEGGAPDKVWWFDGHRRLVTFDERNAAVPTVRKSFQWTVTPTSGHPYIWRVDTTLSPDAPGALTRTSTQARDQYGNVSTAEEWDYGPNQTTRKIFTPTYLSDANYTSRYIRNRLASVTMKVGDARTPTTLARWFPIRRMGRMRISTSYMVTKTTR